MADDLTSNPLSTPMTPLATPPVVSPTPMVTDPMAVPPNLIPTEPPLVSAPVVPLEPISVPVAPTVPAVSEPFAPLQPAAQEAIPEEVQQTVPEEVQPAQEVSDAVSENRMEPKLAQLTGSDDQVDATPLEENVGAEASGEDKKSPLEILEEILAGANAEQDLKTKEEEVKKQKEDEEKAAFEAKKQVFAQEAQVKMAETQTALQEAAAVREKVEEDIKEKDKDKPGALGEEFVINQLSHDTIQTTE